MNEMPAKWALNKAAKVNGYTGWPADYSIRLSRPLRDAIIAHARTIEKYEKPPVDPIEMEIRECVALALEADGDIRLAADARKGRKIISELLTNLLRIRISREKDHPLT